MKKSNGSIKSNDIDELVALLDDSFSKGEGHINVTVKDKQNNKFNKNIDTSCKNKACGIPTLMEGLDDKEKENGKSK